MAQWFIIVNGVEHQYQNFETMTVDLKKFLKAEKHVIVERS
jgi:hypothetical protein